MALFSMFIPSPTSPRPMPGSYHCAMDGSCFYHKRPFSLKESVGQKTRTKRHSLLLKARNVPWRFPARSRQPAKPWQPALQAKVPYRLNPETGTAPEKGQSRTSRAGANTSLPGNTRRKAPPVELPAFLALLRDKKCKRLSWSEAEQECAVYKGKFLA